MTTSTQGPNNPGADNISDESGVEAIKQKVYEGVDDAKQEAGEKVREQAEAGQHRVVDEAYKLSDAIDAAAASLDDDDREGLAQYAHKLSSNLASVAGRLESRSVSELTNDAKQLARNSPALFMLGSMAIGFGLSRFFKASAEHVHSGDDNDENSEYSARDDNFSTGTSTQQRERNMPETYKTSSNVDTLEGSSMP